MSYQYQHFEQAFLLLNGRLALADAPRFNLIVCGGAALVATGLLSRVTRDVDLVALMDDTGVLLDPEPLPSPLVLAAHEVADDLGLYAAVDQSGGYHADDLQALHPTD
jgi:hypothetical protein